MGLCSTIGTTTLQSSVDGGSALRWAATWCGRDTCKLIRILHGHWRSRLLSRVGFLAALEIASTIFSFSVQAHHRYLQNHTKNPCLDQRGEHRRTLSLAIRRS